MARPTKRRRICELPETTEFAPCGKQNTPCVSLGIDEYETIRLIDRLGFTQEDCAAQMHVARTTVQAIYDSARKKLAEALVDGKRLVIGGGSYDICPHAAHCCGKNCAARSCTDKCCDEGAQSCLDCAKQEETI
ncbi:MAG: DUF134 domain-containing protein [Oscillospiraceae bacterium]